MIKAVFVALILPLAGGVSLAVSALEPHALTQAECGSCHAMQAPRHDLAIDERITRKAPPLYYAGNKFRREWLVSWLQEPVPIRPAGYFPPAHTEQGTEGDVVDQESFAEHPRLAAEDAQKAADYLLTLRPYDDKIDAVKYRPGDISPRMGQLNFSKFNGCSACHRDVPDYGGLSGPELYTAWRRLQPEFIASFITDPVAWDPHTLMPRSELNPGVIKKLADYLKVIGEEQP